MTAFNYTETVNQGAVYVDAVPVDPSFDTVYVDGSVDTSALGDYVITYTFMSLSPFKTKTESKLVTVVSSNTGQPVIVLKGQPNTATSAIHNILLDRDGDYSEMDEYLPENALGAEALNGEPVTLIGELRPYIEGSYTLIYTATNNFGTAIATRTLHIKLSVSKPAFGLDALSIRKPPPASGLDVENVVVEPDAPTSGLDIENVVVEPDAKPAVGYPIISVDMDSDTGFSEPQPAVGYPINTVSLQ